MIRKIRNVLSTLVGLALLGLLALTLIALFQGQQSAKTATQPVATSTPVLPENTPIPAVLPTRVPRPTATPAPTQLLLPACQFNGTAPAEEPAPALEAYVFSEPQVVLTHTSAIAVVDWLPDGQRLLITRLIPNSSHESIDVFNQHTREVESYGEWRGFSIGNNPKPVWLESEQVVAFVDNTNKEWALRTSRGKMALVEEPTTGLDSLYIATSPDGQQLIFLPKTPGKQPEVLRGAQAQRQVLALTLPSSPGQEVPLGINGRTIRSGIYHIAWQPGGNRIAFFNNLGFFLTDASSRALCEIDLGMYGEKRWALDAKWSPDGRYLALLTTVGESIVPFANLTLVDMRTGQVRHHDLKHHYLSALAWNPNSHDLLVMAAPEQGDPAQANLYDLYLVNAATGNSRQMLAGYPFMFSGIYGVAWSPSGKEIALACPTAAKGLIAEGRLCIISVEVK